VEEMHKAACEKGMKMYEDPNTGLFVMTAFFLKSRQRCCGSGCRHCPYDKQNE
jgi:ATP-binding cassette subfamily B (MDR/TAP) protein 1